MDTYAKIAEAIRYLQSEYREQPSLEEIAARSGLSPSHFQRLFTQWAGVSPKTFVSYLTHNYARRILAGQQATLFEAALDSGLSGTGRLHDLFIKIEAMTPGEFSKGGAGLQINYSFGDTPFGLALVATTAKGICRLAFTDAPDAAIQDLQDAFPAAKLVAEADPRHTEAFQFISSRLTQPGTLSLHIKGTPFQLKVWEALLRVPHGGLTTYSALARGLDNPGASRAVGSAVGDNPIAYLIPCHRVIRSTGEFGQYMWGAERKAAILGWEAAGLAGNNL